MELIDAAETLFNEKGYDATSVSNIVKKVKVAQGTFYYHFDSKEAIRDAVVDRIVEQVNSNIHRIVDHSTGDALSRMMDVYQFFNDLARGRERLVDELHQEKNKTVHDRIEKAVVPVLVEEFTKLIVYGVEEGTFNTPYPSDAAKALLGYGAMRSEGKHDHTGRTDIIELDLESSVHMMAQILETDKEAVMRKIKQRWEVR